MTQENKELLLKDLCARLPYGVIIRHADYLTDSDGNYTGQFWYKRGYLYNICRMDSMTTTIIESEGSDEEGYEHICDLERSLPYLRPLSSMTEKEAEEYNDLCFCNTPYPGIAEDAVAKFMDWLNAHHLDYRGLIPKGLAIEATKDMYK